MFKDMIGPKEVMMLAEYSPLPTSLVEKLKGMGQQEQQQQDPTQNPAFILEQAKLANAAREIELQTLQEQVKAKELDFKMAELGQKGQLAVMEQQTEERRISVDEIDAYAALAEAQKPVPVSTAN